MYPQFEGGDATDVITLARISSRPGGEIDLIKSWVRPRSINMWPCQLRRLRIAGDDVQSLRIPVRASSRIWS